MKAALTVSLVLRSVSNELDASIRTSASPASSSSASGPDHLGSKMQFETLSTRLSGNQLPSSIPTSATWKRPASTYVATASSPTSSKLKLLPRRRAASRHFEQELSLKKTFWRATQLGSQKTTKSSRWKSSAN